MIITPTTLLGKTDAELAALAKEMVLYLNLIASEADKREVILHYHVSDRRLAFDGLTNSKLSVSVFTEVA